MESTINNVCVLQVCLEEYNYDMESVINAILEDKLPQALQDLDRNLKRYSIQQHGILYSCMLITNLRHFVFLHVDNKSKAFCLPAC